MHLFRRYSKNDQTEWNTFVAKSKNGTFLFDRAYMEYHADRFEDHSLIVEDQGRVLALLPANRTGDILHCHAGLTYGGFVTSTDMLTPTMLAIFSGLREYLSNNGIGSLIYKTIPSIYHKLPAQEDCYALFREGAQLIRRDVLAVVDPAQAGPVQTRRKRGSAKAIRVGVVLCEARGDHALWSNFWCILETVLDERHGVQPVHSFDQIMQLRQNFPENIRLFVATLESEIIGGVVIYESAVVAHVQYIAASQTGRSVGALDFLLLQLIEDIFSAKHWFDFGISTENDGRILNQGLIEQKEGFGARAVVHDFYKMIIR